MEEKRKDVERYLSEKMKKGWPFVQVVNMNNTLGYYAKDTLNDMMKEKLIRRRQGVNGILIEITEDGMAYLRRLQD